MYIENIRLQLFALFEKRSKYKEGYYIKMDENADKEEQIKVLYNSRYGGWGMSTKARDLYKLRKQDLGYVADKDWNRHNPILVQIFEELGVEFNDKFSTVDIEYIPKKYEKYYYITVDNGLETVEINYMKYEFVKLKEQTRTILTSNMMNDEKISLLNKLYIDTV